MARYDIGTIASYAAPRMVSFFVTFVLYFLLIGYTEKNSIQSTILKCLPIVSLWIFVLLSGFKLENSQRYKHLILIGLVFSFLGDILLNYDQIEVGTASFAVAQGFYTSAFGLHPLKLWLALPLYGYCALAIGIMFNNLSLIFKICLPVYSFLVLTMCWRALARIKSTRNIFRMACGIGSVLFVISDSIIAYDMFYTPLSNARLPIMLTYYAAQFGIALSVVEPSSGPAQTVKSPPSKQQRQHRMQQKKSS